LGSMFCESCYFSNCPNRWRWRKDGREQAVQLPQQVVEAEENELHGMAGLSSNVNYLRQFINEQLGVQCADPSITNVRCYSQRIAATICCTVDQTGAAPHCEADASTYVNYFDDEALTKWHQLQQTLKSFFDAMNGADTFDLVGNRYCISLNDCCVNGKCDGKITCSTTMSREAESTGQEGEEKMFKKLFELLKREDTKRLRDVNDDQLLFMD